MQIQNTSSDYSLDEYHIKDQSKKLFDDKPLISIITVVFNGKPFLEQTIQSVINQTYENIEYIIIDGASTDGTLDIIKKYENKLDYWVSEKDKGISEAFNKGIKQATGEFILMLNCGDTFISDTVIDFDLLLKSKNKIITFQAKTTHGNVFPLNHTYSTQKSHSFSTLRKLVQNAMVAHQATFVPKCVYDEIGGYSHEYTVRMDFEFFLRASQKFEIEFYQKPIVIYLTNGISSKLKNRIIFKMEELKAIHNTICNACLLYDVYFFVSLPFYLSKKLLSSMKYTLLEWRK